jgi:hypothetical protein
MTPLGIHSTLREIVSAFLFAVSVVLVFEEVSLNCFSVSFLLAFLPSSFRSPDSSRPSIGSLTSFVSLDPKNDLTLSND